MKFKFVFWFCCLYLASASLVLAEYYQYVDKNGVKHYTDDLSQVPHSQRTDLNTYESIQSQNSGTEIPSQTKKKETAENEITGTFESLMAEKNRLDKEYEALKTKKEGLIGQQKTLSLEEYNAQATQLNTAAKQYQERRDNYNKRVQLYNKQLAASESN